MNARLKPKLVLKRKPILKFKSNLNLNFNLNFKESAVNFIFTQLKEKIYPTMMATMDKFLESPTTPFFGLLTGDVQLTKTNSLLVIIWTQIFRHQRLPAFMTADSTELREQIMNTCQAFNIHINHIVNEYNHLSIYEEDKLNAEDFYLNGQPYAEFKLSSHLPGAFPIFIQEKTNLENLLRLYNQCKRVQTPMTVVIDEIDDLYSLSWEQFDIKGLTEKMVSRGNVLKILYDLAMNNQLKIIGITATPGVLLQSKQIIPTCMQRVQTDGFPGCQYIGSIEHSQVTQQVLESLDDAEILDWIQVIEEQPHLTINLSQTSFTRGKGLNIYKLQKLIAINTHQKIDDQVRLTNLINETFPDLFSIFVFNTENSKVSLNQFLEQCSPYQTVIVIGRARMRRGVRIKPTSHTRISKGYALAGITDYFLKVSGNDPNVEGIQQSMRQYGIYPMDFQQTIYSTQSGLDKIKIAEQINETLKSHGNSTKENGNINILDSLVVDHPLPLVSKKKNALICQQPKTGSQNVKCVISDSSPGNPPGNVIIYQTSSSFNFNVCEYWGNKNSLGCLSSLPPETQLSTFHNQSKWQNELRRAISLECIKRYPNLSHLKDKIQIGYRENRWGELIRASVFPKDPSESHWQVNVLIGPPDSFLSNLPITIFEQSWSDRQSMHTGCNGDIHMYQLANQKWVQVVRDCENLETAKITYQYKPYTLSEAPHGEEFQTELLEELGETGKIIRASLSNAKLQINAGHAFEITTSQYQNYVKVSSAHAETKRKLSICVGRYASLLVFKEAILVQIPGINMLSLACLLEHAGYQP